MSDYPKTPTNHAEAVATLVAFAQTAPGRLPERVEVALNLVKPAKTINFSDALIALKLGKSVRRNGWNGAGLLVKLEVPDPASSLMTLPYLYIQYPEYAKNTPGARCPWLASQTDILAEDWIICD